MQFVEYIFPLKYPIIIIWLICIFFFIFLSKKKNTDLDFFESVSLLIPIIIFGLLFVVTSVLLVLIVLKSGLDLIPNNKYGVMILIGIAIIPFLIKLDKK